MPEPDPLDDLGLKPCPRCMTPMEPAGNMREVTIADVLVAEGQAWWSCPSCGLTAVV